MIAALVGTLLALTSTSTYVALNRELRHEIREHPASIVQGIAIVALYCGLVVWSANGIAAMLTAP